jgi:hypothetical protein
MKNILCLVFIFISFNVFSQNTKITISAIGDIMAHDNLQEYALATDKGYDVFFEQTKNIFLNDDLTIGNLETPVNDLIGVKGYPCFNAKTSLVDSIKKAGIEAVSLANNHSYDQGEKGVISTLETVNKAGIINSGTGFTPGESKIPKIFTVKDIKIGFFSFTFSLNGSNIIESADHAYVNLVPMENEKRLQEFYDIIKETKKNVDIMIVSYHCGDEYKSEPVVIQEKVLKQIAEAGADVVLGHHPHVLEKVEYYETKDARKVLIAYSLGNFISAQARYIPKLNDENKWIYDSVLSKTAEGMILQFDITNWEGKFYVSSPRIIPIFNLCFVYRKNNRNYDGYQVDFMEKILKMDEKSDARFAKNIGQIKNLVSYRLEKIKKLVNLPIITPEQ